MRRDLSIGALRKWDHCGISIIADKTMGRTSRLPARGPSIDAFRHWIVCSFPCRYPGLLPRPFGQWPGNFMHSDSNHSKGLSGQTVATPVTRTNSAAQVVPGSMISVGLLSGDMNITADGTVTFVDGKKVYAFGHRFLDIGSTDIPFAHSEVVALIPSLNSSFKLSAPGEWVGSIVSDRASCDFGRTRPAGTYHSSHHQRPFGRHRHTRLPFPGGERSLSDALYYSDSPILSTGRDRAHAGPRHLTARGHGGMGERSAIHLRSGILSSAIAD